MQFNLQIIFQNIHICQSWYLVSHIKSYLVSAGGGGVDYTPQQELGMCCALSQNYEQFLNKKNDTSILEKAVWGIQKWN